jgi:tetratricopeptide (TPR) repeat protein
MNPTHDEVRALWDAGRLRAACDLAASRIAAQAQPFRDQFGDDDLPTATHYHELGQLCWHLARLDQAQAAFDRALAIRTARLGVDHLDTLATRERLAACAHYSDQPAVAIAIWSDVIDKLNDIDGERGLRTAIARRNFSALQRDRDVGAARGLVNQASAFFARHVDPGDDEYLAMRKAEAMLLLAESDRDGALRLADRAVEHARFERAHPLVATARLIRARALADHPAEARPVADEVVAALSAGTGDHPLLALALGFRGQLAVAENDLDAARDLHTRAFAMYRGFYPAATSTHLLGTQLRSVLRRLGDEPAVVELSETLRDIRKRSGGAHREVVPSGRGPAPQLTPTVRRLAWISALLFLGLGAALWRLVGRSTTDREISARASAQEDARIAAATADRQLAIQHAAVLVADIRAAFAAAPEPSTRDALQTRIMAVVAAIDVDVAAHAEIPWLDNPVRDRYQDARNRLVALARAVGSAEPAAVLALANDDALGDALAVLPTE